MADSGDMDFTDYEASWRVECRDAIRQWPNARSVQSWRLRGSRAELRAATSLIRLLADVGRRAEARKLLTAIYVGSPKGSTRPIRSALRHCSTSWREPVSPAARRGIREGL